MRIRVECYSGYRSNERPLKFYLGEKLLEVEELLDRWYGEDHDYFKLLADDGNTYLLKYHRIKDRWELVIYSSGKFSPSVKDKAIYLSQSMKNGRNRLPS